MITKQTVVAGVVVVMGVATCVSADEARLAGVDTWAYRKALPAVVNPVVRSSLNEVISLRGKWEFVTQGVAPSRHPYWRAFYAKPWPGSRTIQVPGCWEAQGVGESGPSVTWDCKWDHGPRMMRNVYMGEAWYRKTIDIPAAWQSKRVWLKVGGVRSQGWFWVNEKPVAWVDNYCGTYKYDITDLVQGRTQAVVVAAVNNKIPSRKGQMVSSHQFGGLYRDVEIEATPDMRIDDAWVRGDFDKQTAEVHATVAYATIAGKLKSPVLRVKIKSVDVSHRDTEGVEKTAGTGKEAVIFGGERQAVDVTVCMPLKPFNAWSPETPNLYMAELMLCDGDTPIHGWTERFGVRKIEVRGDRFFLNNKPFFARGFGDDFVYPLTVVSPASKEEHLKHLKIARAAGFNYVRLHTHCELPEYFEAADEVGIMIQPELPYYGDYPTEAFTFDPMRDLTELYHHYRRYVSFTTYCTGNEGLLGKPLDKEIYKLAKQLDPDRLMIHQDGNCNNAENSDFRNGPVNVWEPGSFKCDAPFVAHEYLNLGVKQDARNESRFIGGWMPPVSQASRDQLLQSSGLNRRWGDAIQDASHALQRYYQKRGIEAARIDPACDGYDFWTIVDVVVAQGSTYSAQGLFDPFWDAKRNGATAASFREFNGSTALLLKTESKIPIAVPGDRVKANFWITHFGEKRLEKTRLHWILRTVDQTLAQGECEGGDVELGSTRLLAEAAIAIPDVAKPVHAVLEAEVLQRTEGGGRKAEERIMNMWDFWLFPKRDKQDGTGIAVAPTLLPALEKLYTGLVASGTSAGEQADLLISQARSPDVDIALAAGKRVLLINGTSSKPNVNLGWWSMGNQVGTAFAKHPAFGDFPHDGTLSPLAFRLLKQGKSLPFTGVLPDDMMVVGEGLSQFFLYMGQAKSDKGRVLMTFGLDLLSGTPEGTCLLDNLIRYTRSDAFNPQSVATLTFETQNGWQKTLKAGDFGRDNLPFGVNQLDVARALKDKNELIWETRPAPENVQSKKDYNVVWRGGMGYFSEPQGHFTFYVNNEKLIDIPAISHQDAEWCSADKTVSLKYVRDTTTDEYGTLTLTLPSSKVMPGKPLHMKVVGSDSNSRRWFGVFETW